MKSLAGRTVVITRAADQADETSRLVASFDGIPLVVPLIEIVDEPSGMDELAELRLDEIDWIVVTSPNGARRVAHHLVSRKSPTPRIAAIGGATAALLPRCDLVADTQSAAGLLEIFPPGPGRIVVVQALDAEPTLVNGLVEIGWDAYAIKAFRARAVQPSDDQQRAALAADAVLFASGSAARAWVEIFGLSSPPVVIAIGGQTAEAVGRAGLKVSATSADHSVYGMLVCLGEYFSDRN
jgi:uroporphyrinogen-III synthase